MFIERTGFKLWELKVGGHTVRYSTQHPYALKRAMRNYVIPTICHFNFGKPLDIA